MKSVLLVMAILMVSGSAFAEGEDIAGKAKRLLDSAWRMGRATRFAAYQEKRLAKACSEVTNDELGKVIDALRLREEPGKSLPAILTYLTNEYHQRRFGPLPMKHLPDFALNMLSDEPAARIALLSGSLFLEDLRLAEHLALTGVKHESPEVRYRATIALGDLINYGVEGEQPGKELLARLYDEAPEVRIVACRRAFEVGLDPVFQWAMDHLGDGEKVKLVLRGKEEVTTPGAAALTGIQELTRVQREMTWEELLRLSKERLNTFRDLCGAWWEEAGKTFPVPGFREARFRGIPSSSKRAMVASGATTASLNFWAGLDRTRIRLAVDELECTASSAAEFDVNFHVRYMAQGMRTDDGEAYRRHFPVGERFVLARKAIGCFVLVFQVLTEGRLRIHLRFFDPLL